MGVLEGSDFVSLSLSLSVCSHEPFTDATPPAAHASMMEYMVRGLSVHRCQDG